LDKTGFLTGFAVGLIVLGIVLMFFAYQVYQVRVQYEREYWQLYQLTHSDEYNAVIKGLQSMEDFFNKVTYWLMKFRLDSLAMKSAMYSNKTQTWIYELEQVQKATEKTLEISYLEGALQSTGFLTIIIGIIILAATIAYTKLKKK